MADTKALKDRIQDLEAELAKKNLEVAKYRQELARANHSLEKLIMDLNNELKLASKIQKVLSPTEIPSIPGFEFSTKFVPGMKFGGDYFDIFEHEDKLKFGILVAASSGYTMSALFLSVLMKYSAQIEARRGVDPSKVVSQLAAEVATDMKDKDSLSILYAVVDRRNFEVSYCSIGKVFFAHLVHGEDKLVILEPTSGPLTKSAMAEPLLSKINLSPRDRLIICTEGVLQEKGPHKEIFGKERLISAVNQASKAGVHDMRNEILYRVESYMQAQFPERDETVIITEVKDKVIKLAKKT